MKIQKATARDRQRERETRGMRVDDSARRLALQRRDQEWRRRRASAAVGVA